MCVRSKAREIQLLTIEPLVNLNFELGASAHNAVVRCSSLFRRNTYLIILGLSISHDESRTEGRVGSELLVRWPPRPKIPFMQ